MARSRGATVVEYALGVSFILATSLGAATTFNEESSEAFQERGSSIGAPDLDVPSSTTSVTAAPDPSPGSTTSTTAAPAPPSSITASGVGTAHTSGNRWTATVVVTVADNGNPLHKAVVQGQWNAHPGGSIENAVCETQPNGNCTFTLRNLGKWGSDNHTAYAVFNVTSVTPHGGTTTNPSLTVTVTEP